jgi:ubiquitin-protein ligase
MNVIEKSRSIVHDVFVKADIVDGPTHSGHWGKQEFKVDSFYAAYSYIDGEWECTSASVHGPNVKKDGSLGLKIVKDNYYRPSHSAPAWLNKIVDTLRPKPGVEG